MIAKEKKLKHGEYKKKMKTVWSCGQYATQKPAAVKLKKPSQHRMYQK